jgi:hypothetical protein
MCRRETRADNTIGMIAVDRYHHQRARSRLVQLSVTLALKLVLVAFVVGFVGTNLRSAIGCTTKAMNTHSLSCDAAPATTSITPATTP